MEEALLPFKPLEVGVHKGAGDLPGPVGTEVHEDDGIPLADFRVFGGDDRHHELVGDAGVIAGLHGPHRVADEALLAFAVHHGLIGALHPVPVGVPVHGVVPPGDGGDLGPVPVAGLLHLGHKVLAGGGGHVAPVHEAVHENPGAAQAVGHLHRRLNVGDVAVDAAVGHQAVNVDRLPGVFGRQHGVLIGGVLKKVPVLNGLGDLGQILEHHPACADVGVAHLAVSHLAVGQAHVQPGGGEGGVGELLEEAVQPGRFGGLDGVSRLSAAGAEAVHDDQSSRCFVH